MLLSVQIAQLALKHRQNKNQRQRIVIFIGSPIQEDKVGQAPSAASRLLVLPRQQPAELGQAHCQPIRLPHAAALLVRRTRWSRLPRS